jgi:nucleoside 2-deoxyribosyltransferase
MKIYLSGAIRGGRELQKVYYIIYEHLKTKEIIVLTYHVALPNVIEIEDALSDSKIYNQDISWLKECDAVIAETSVPSLGVGYEISYALHILRKPVLCVYEQKRAPISAMISGNSSQSLIIYSYRDISDLLRHIDNFLDFLQS